MHGRPSLDLELILSGGVFELEGYTAKFVSVGNGRGLVTYSRGNFQHKQDVKEDDLRF